MVKSNRVRFQTVLCPTDFSEASQAAMETAGELCRRFGGEMLLVNVVAPLPLLPATASMGPVVVRPNTGVDTYMDGLREQHMAKLKALAGEKFAPGIVVRPFLGEGEAASEIVRIAAEKNVDVIVIATHGETGWRHFVFGSVAERVVRLSPCPVLTVRPDRPEEPE